MALDHPSLLDISNGPIPRAVKARESIEEAFA
jgi:hypothetical protein